MLTKGMSTAVNKKIVKALICLEALHISETWSLRKEDIRKLEAVSEENNGEDKLDKENNKHGGT